MRDLLYLIVAIACAWSALPSVRAADRPPNVVVILTDDMGYADVGPFGASEIPTPHIDRLAAEGTRCTSAYAAAPICVPSRMALLTGRYHQRFGIYSNVYGVEANRLWLEQKTLADMLAARGYRSGVVGKWHLSGNGGRGTDDLGGFQYAPPHERGFGEFVGIFGGMDGFQSGTGLGRLVAGRYERFPAPEYLTDCFGSEACDFIRRHAAEPFFLYLAFTAPHAPLQALDEDRAAITAEGISDDRRTYAAMVRAVDRNVGRVMDQLREAGLDCSTLTIFLNDNGGGGNNAAAHTRNTARNHPYRGHKFDVWEGGVRVPFIIHWPERVAAGATYDGLVSAMDVVPTCVAAAGATATDLLDGVDVLPFLDGRRAGSPHGALYWKQLVWERPNERKLGPGTPKPAFGKAVRRGIWKAVRQDQPFSGGDDSRPWELYDLSRDPAELNDVASEFPETVRDLATMFSAWEAEMTPPADATQRARAEPRPSDRMPPRP